MKHRNSTRKVGRNEPCPCDSGKKYKNCCLTSTLSDQESLAVVYRKRYNIRLKSPRDVEGIRKAGALVLSTFDAMRDLVRPGVLTDHINTAVHEFTIANRGIPAPLNYRGFPKSVCVSVNDVICHGIPGSRELKNGDIVNVDITTILDGYYADANQTFFVGTPGPEARKLVDVTRQCLKRGMEMVRPGGHIGDIGWAIQRHAESSGCSVVREFVGHGIGFDFHEAPQVSHFGQRNTGVRLVPGMVFTIEPMINLGRPELKILDDKWTAVTVDGSLSAQFEQTILVTDDGFESLTPYTL
jgi:methionyl aminopeptidase